MAFLWFKRWLNKLFGKKKSVRLGFYGPPNAGKTTLANKISKDWTGTEIGKVSEVPHETRVVQKKEKVIVRVGNKKIEMDLLDMPGIATKVDFEEFVDDYKMSEEEAKQRAKEATGGIIEAIKWLENVDVAIVVFDASLDPYTQTNITIIGNFEARKIPIILVANKMDIKNANVERIKNAFPQHDVLAISAKDGTNIDKLYKIIAKYA